MSENEIKKGASIIQSSGTKADLFMTATEKMAIDNFRRMLQNVLRNLVKRYNKPESDLLDLATDITIKLEPDGFAAVDKWADMEEQFRMKD